MDLQKLIWEGEQLITEWLKLRYGLKLNWNRVNLQLFVKDKILYKKA